MTQITKEQLGSMLPNATQANLERFIVPLIDAMDKYGITSPLRICAFMAQVSVETGGLNYMHELWGPTPEQTLYERDFGHAWPPTPEDRRNESAWSLGNSEVGDGRKFRGHGIFQITGRANHQYVSKELGVDFVSNPELLEGPVYACASAGHFWMTHDINRFADIPDFDGCCDMVNRGHKTRAVGDANDYQKRLTAYNLAKKVLNIS